jgi:hypothetical protein
MDNVATLTSLAMLKVNSDVEGRDYADYIVPFIGFVLNTEKPDPVTAADTQISLKREFGLNIPQYPTEYVLHRLADRKYLRRENHAYHPVKPIPTNDIESRRESLRQQLQDVVDALREFAASRQALNWSPNEAQDALLSYLRRFSIECLKTYTHGSPLPDTEPLAQRELLTVNLFVKMIHADDKTKFESFVALVKGHMLANALVCSDLKSITRDFGSLVFYFDTPLVLRLLGLEAEARATAAAELVELLQRLKGHCAIFEHTLEETKGVIDGAERHLDDPAARGRVIEEMRRRGMQKSDLRLMSGRLEQTLKDKGIGRRATPKYDSHSTYQISEALLEDAIRDEVEYLNPRALHYDINSVRSIYALRRGRAPARLEDSGAVLVTSNSALARATFQYGREHESSREVSAVITDFSLANVAWLKAPLKAPDLPEVEVMASCYAALEPSAPLWNKYVTEIDKLKALGNISADDHQLLRHSPPARTELVDLTGGSEQAFNPGTVNEILERVKAELRAELAKERDELLQAERMKLADAERSHLAARENYEGALSQAQQARQRALQEAERIASERERTRARISAFAESIARSCRWGVTITLGLIVAIALVVEAIRAEHLLARMAWIVTPVIIVGIVLTWLHAVIGASVRELGERFERQVRDGILKLADRFFEDDQEPRNGPAEL